MLTELDIQVKYGENVWPLYVLSNVELAGSAHYAIYGVCTSWNSFDLTLTNYSTRA